MCHLSFSGQLIHVGHCQWKLSGKNLLRTSSSVPPPRKSAQRTSHFHSESLANPSSSSAISSFVCEHAVWGAREEGAKKAPPPKPGGITRRNPKIFMSNPKWNVKPFLVDILQHYFKQLKYFAPEETDRRILEWCQPRNVPLWNTGNDDLLKKCTWTI